MNYIVFLFGLIIGSFLNVVIYRLPEEQSIVSPPSHCFNCETELKAWDLIPVFSYLLTKGRCRYCNKKISIQYPLVELGTAVVFLLLYWSVGWGIELLLYLFLASLIIVSSIIDLERMIIPNRITYFGIIAGFFSSLIFDHLSVLSSLVGIIIPAAVLLLIIILSRGGMGIGDVKLVAMIGSFLGPWVPLVALFIGSLIGAIILLPLIFKEPEWRKTKIPFGPLISLGSLLIMIWGEELISFYFNLFNISRGIL